MVNLIIIKMSHDMKRVFLFTILIYFGLINIVAQNHTQELINLLMQDNFFKARDYHQAYKDQIDAGGELFYKYRMSYFQNKPDSAVIYLEKFVKDYPNFAPDEFNKLSLYNLLINLYTDVEDNQKLVDTYNKAEQLILTAPFNNDSVWKQNQLALLSYFRSEVKKKPNTPIDVVRTSNKTDVIALQKGSFITAIAQFNGVSLRAVFDTGSGFHLFIKKEYADKCQFKEIPSQTDSVQLNGTMVRAGFALVDSIKIGPILFTNITAFVLHDDPKSLLPDSISLDDKERKGYNSFFESCDVIVGLPLLRLLGSICVDWEKNTMTMKPRLEVPIENVSSNMIISERRLFTELSINNIDCVGSVDTGNSLSCINLNPEFYAKNSSSILLSQGEKSKNVSGMTSIDRGVKYKHVLNPTIVSGMETVSLEEPDDCIVWLDKPKSKRGWEDGEVGLLFLKQLGSNVKIDFVNMRIISE